MNTFVAHVEAVRRTGDYTHASAVGLVDLAPLTVPADCEGALPVVDIVGSGTF